MHRLVALIYLIALDILAVGEYMTSGSRTVRELLVLMQTAVQHCLSLHFI